MLYEKYFWYVAWRGEYYYYNRRRRGKIGEINVRIFALKSCQFRCPSLLFLIEFRSASPPKVVTNIFGNCRAETAPATAGIIVVMPGVFRDSSRSGWAMMYRRGPVKLHPLYVWDSHRVHVRAALKTSGGRAFFHPDPRRTKPSINAKMLKKSPSDYVLKKKHKTTLSSL